VSRFDDNKNLELKRRKYRYGREIQRCPIVRIAWFYFVVYTIYLIHQITISLYLYPLTHSPARSIPFLSNQTSNSRRGRPHGTTNQGHAINPGTNISGKRQGQSFVRAIRSARPPTHGHTHSMEPRYSTSWLLLNPGGPDDTATNTKKSDEWYIV
jgi:hypothetical protein